MIAAWGSLMCCSMLGLQVGNDIVLRLEFIKERQMKVSALFSSSSCASAAPVSASANRAWCCRADCPLWRLGSGVPGVRRPDRRHQPEAEQGDGRQRMSRTAW